MLLATIAAASAGAAAAQDRAFSKPYWLDRSVIEAQGRAEIEVAANRARFSVSFVETDRTAADASAKATERARLAYKAIKAKAGKDARVETNVSVMPIYDTYKDKDGNVLRYDTPDRVSSYAASADMTVTLEDPAKAGEARAAALAARPENAGSVQFYLQQTAEMTRQAFAAAAKDAFERAKAAAAASGATLGPLLVLQEGQGPCLGQWYAPAGQYGDGVPTMAYAAAAPPPPAPVAEAMIGGRKVQITEADIERLNLPSDPSPMSIGGGVCAVYAVAK
jgi:hypothetical protein